MEGPTLKRKVAVVSRLNDSSRSSSPALRPNLANIPRAASPSKAPISTDNFRPKAKINSTATVRKAASTIGSSLGRSSSSRPNSSSGPPRPPSPTKTALSIRHGTLSPTFQPKVVGGSSIRSATPELRNRSFTTSSDALRPSDDLARTRKGSLSLQHSVSQSPLYPTNGPSPRQKPPETSPMSNTNTSPPVRITSKVTARAKNIINTPTPSPSGSSHLSARPMLARTRAPSISSSSSVHSNTPPVFYPITTATPAANPHRYATPRPSPSRLNNTFSHNQYQPFGHARDDPPIQQLRLNGMAKVDPASIPLPPNSPPSSSLSFSSRSSISHSSYASESGISASSVPTTQQNGSPEGLGATLDQLERYAASRDSADSSQDQDTDGEHNDEERKVRAEAKSNRKIADLEITNCSLLAINSSLESTKNRQAKEIRELRRKLRESRLILPPIAFKAVKSSLDHDDTAEESGESDEEEAEEEAEAQDETYKRVKAILDGLLETGRQALETTKEDFSEGGKGVAKVLTADEVRTWRDSRGGASDIDAQSILELDKDDDLDIDMVPLSKGTINQSQRTLVPEVDDIETRATHSRSSSPVPPILITRSS